MKNTIALAYLNPDGVIVAWSADTFGSPRNYPKTYGDSESTREMLRKKFKTREKFGEAASELISHHNFVAGAIMEASMDADKDIFVEKNIVKAEIVALNLYTDYKSTPMLPSWEQVKACIDNKDYSIISQTLTNG